MGPTRTYEPQPRVLVRQKRSPMLFGVAWDMETPAVLNAIAIDVISYSRLVPTTCRLVLVCQDFGFLDTLASITGIEITSDPALREKCEIWKLYYVEECPDLPANGKHVYQKKVSNFGKSEVRMSQGMPKYPSLYNPNDNVVVPVGRSPNINKIPPRFYNNLYNGLPSV